MSSSSSIEIRPYDQAQDFDAVRRIWLEAGWIEQDDPTEPLLRLLQTGTMEVALINGIAESMTHWSVGTIRYQNTDLPLGTISAVLTSRVGRGQQLATTLTARAVADAASQGAAVSNLGIFEQGFYNRLGFGNGAYNYRVTFDPGTLKVDHVASPSVVRIGADDYAEFAALHRRRYQTHGSVSFESDDNIYFDLASFKHPFGLGVRDQATGRLVMAMVGESSGSYGPYNIRLVAYEEPHQFVELMRILKNLSDQVRRVIMIEPSETTQLQDLIAEPLRQKHLTASSDTKLGAEGLAWWQIRILDLEAVVGARHWPGPPVRFNLVLDDPIEPYLEPGEHPWSGVGGHYVVTIGSPSAAEPGSDPSLPTVEASVNAFSRAWFGVRPPSGLAVTDTMRAPTALLSQLDEALCLPTPNPGWDF